MPPGSSSSGRRRASSYAIPTPSFYAYRMTTPGGRATNGVIGALGIDEQSAAETFPHELTLSKAEERPPRSPAGHQGQPLAHLGAVAELRA